MTGEPIKLIHVMKLFEPKRNFLESFSDHIIRKLVIMHQDFSQCTKIER